jgi:TPR repeat protein
LLLIKKLVVAQNNYGLCLHSGETVGIDFKGAAHCFKLATDQGDADAQFNDGLRLETAEGARIDFNGAADYFTLAADQGIPQAHHGHALGLTSDFDRNLVDALQMTNLCLHACSNLSPQDPAD